MVSLMLEVPSVWADALHWLHSFVWMQAQYTVEMNLTKSRSVSSKYEIARKEEGI